MVEIHKKILPGYFEALVSGEKKYELRLADEDLIGAKPGDVLVLEEWDGLGNDRKQTGRVIRKEISKVGHFTLDELSRWWSREEIEKKGFLIFSLKD